MQTIPPLQKSLPTFIIGLLIGLMILLFGVTDWHAMAQSAYPINLGDHGKVQFVDPDGLNIFYFAEYDQSESVEFTLYNLNGSQFSTLYHSAGRHDVLALPDVSQYTQVTSWQANLSSLTNHRQQIYRMALPEDVPSGNYLVTASNGVRDPSASLLVVSRHSLVLKHAPGGQISAWASKLRGGTPMAGMMVTFYDADGSSVGQAETDANGVAKIQSNIAGDRYSDLIAVGQLGNETTLAGFSQLWYTYSYTGSYYGNRTQYSAFLNTDRPIYRPGDTVQFAAILREFVDGIYQPLTEGTAVTVKLKDSRYNDVTTLNLTADSFGMVAGDYLLGVEPPLGNYRIHLSIGDEDNAPTFYQAFKVESYVKPEYKVDVSVSEPYVISGDTFNIIVDSDYFFGQPVTNAAINVKVYRSYYYRYRWWEGFFADDIRYPSHGYRELLDEFNGVTDANGNWTQPYVADLSDPYGAAYSIVATVTDERERPIQGRANIPVFWNTFNLRAQVDRYGYDSNDPVTVNLQAQDHTQTPVAGQTLQVKVESRVYNNNWYDSYYQQVAEQSATTDADGNAQVTFNSLPQGWYRITSTTTDARGRSVDARTYAWIYDRSARSWYYFNNSQISLTFDQPEYGPGDTAQLLIQSRITNTMALVTIEREEVMDEFIVNLDGPVTKLDIPIKEAYKPNAFVKVHAFAPTGRESLDTFSGSYHPNMDAEAELVTGWAKLSVPAEDKRLDIQISSDADVYGAGDQATLTFQVNNADGQGEESRIILAVVDEAIFSLSEDLTADIFTTFYGDRGSSIFTYQGPIDPRIYYRHNVPNEATTTATPAPTGAPTSDMPSPEPAEGDSDSRDDSGGDEINTRRIFEDTAYWNPAITTDANGAASVTITLPDNLTEWRIIARAVTLDTKVGESIDSILVTQEVIARPNLPRFSILGDRFDVGVVGQNYTGQDASGETVMSADGLLLLDDAPQKISIPNGGSGSATWTAVASHVGTNLVTSTVALNGPSGVKGDRVELPFVTKPFAVPDRYFTSGQVTEEISLVTETLTIPFNAVNEETTLKVQLSPSIALSLLENLDSLIRYPYGCVEQTMSRMLPTAAAAKVYTQLGIPNPKEDELPKIVTQGLQKLYGYQHNNGSWGWFYDDNPGTYLTSYVLFGLQTIKDAGFEVDEDVLSRGFSYLEQNLSRTESISTQAYALYVLSLADRSDVSTAANLLATHESMQPFGQAMLAMALHTAGDSSGANQVLDTLLSNVTETELMASWPAPDYDKWTWFHWRSMASGDKNTAAAIQAINRIRPDEPRLPKAVRWLMNERQSASRYYRGAGWSNTQATAFAVLGLLEYIQTSGELESNYAYSVKLNGETVAIGNVTPDNFVQPIDPVLVHGGDMQLGNNVLQIERTASGDGSNRGALYYSSLLSTQMYYDQFEEVSSSDKGITVSRSYELVQGTPRDDGAYNVGDIVRVRVKVTSDSDKGYIYVTSPIPAGFEAINSRLNTVQYTGNYEQFNWREWGYNRKDLRDDSVDYFISHFYRGEREFSFLMRAIVAGEFSVLPAEASPMYREDIWGRSSSEKMLIEPERLVQRPVLLGDFDNDCRITAFDLRQAAGRGSGNLPSAVVGSDGLLGVQDLAMMAKRDGATCTADITEPTLGTASGQATFRIEGTGGEYSVFQPFQIQIYLESLQGLDHSNGFDVKLRTGTGSFQVVGIELGSAAAGAMIFGKDAKAHSGTISFGLYDLPTTVQQGDLLATVTLRPNSAGTATLQGVTAQAINGQGELVAANVISSGDYIINGEELFFPLVVQ